ncbi:MAG TPA: tetratricopeptide repeat protein [Terriglobales bacterium]|nr:tetratricopeptide repeat protein [Terriglobales bacterium]
MAFGFGFNKQKVLSAAEKFVQQGKLPNAITEYEKILKADPKDLTVMNTVGDLYARVGNNDKAVECFKSVGDAYASQGFTVKAIAMYKKLGKLKSSLESVLRLAELYSQQGLFNDARAQYLQVAEEFLREGQLEQAVRIFQKTLEMDPENVAMRTRLAEVYVRLNKKTEAWQIFSAAAESLRAKGQLDAAEEILQRMLKLDPNSSYALLMRGRTAFEAGDMAGAIAHLEKVADLDSNPDGLRTLMQAYLQADRVADAGALAAKLLSVHNDIGAILNYAEALVAAGHFEEALQVYEQHCERLLAADSGKILQTLHSLIAHVRDNTAGLEKLLGILQKAGDTSHISEIYELLAHASVQSGELEKARDYYLKLTQLEPENQLHARNYQQVLGKLGSSSGAHLISAEEGAVLVDELEATAPFVDQRYGDDVALAIRAALTDAELFISYNMPTKALAPLLSALPQAPRDLRLNQKLAALHTRAGRFTEAAVCCRTLEGIYHEAGYPDEASRYGDLASKYEDRAGATPAAPPETPLATLETAVMPEIPEAVVDGPAAPETAEFPATPTPAFAVSAEAPAAESAEFAVHAQQPESEEIDISAEWEGAVADQPASTESGEALEAGSAAPEEAVVDEQVIGEVTEEIRFYLSNGMTEEAQTAFRKLRRLQPDKSKLEAVRSEIEAVMNKASQPEAAEAVSVEEVPEAEAEAAPAPETEATAAPEMEVAAAPGSSAIGELVNDLESSLGDGFLPQTTVQESAPVLPATELHGPEAAQPGGGLNEFVSDLEASLGDGFLAEAPVASAPTEAESKVVIKPEPLAPVSAPAAMAASAAQGAAVAGSAPGFTYQPTPVRPLAPVTAATPAAADSAAHVDLADMFGELKHELEEDSTSTEEDPETHYNLGVAFREMGLLDEAIAELQKVCQAADRGQKIPQIMQTYTWLAQCFLDKGVPEAAIRWYEQALKLPNLEQDTRTALHYELASSYEVAGNKSDALHHFMEVYGSNIDYRDVAERVKSLKS